MIVALDKGLPYCQTSPKIGGIRVNLGPNMSQDSYHSGTMGAAREAGLYGMPAASFTHRLKKACKRPWMRLSIVEFASEYCPLCQKTLDALT